jgi:hypothetical protein
MRLATLLMLPVLLALEATVSVERRVHETLARLKSARSPATLARRL